MRDRKIKVLQIIDNFKKGGVQADVMFPARILNQEDVQFDVLLFSDILGYYEDEFSHYGSIYRIFVPKRHNRIRKAISLFTNYFRIKKQVVVFLKKHNDYDAIHARHLFYNAPCISAAHASGIKVRIAHCHANKPIKKTNKDHFHVRLYLWICSMILNKKATHRFGVTSNAVEYMFGRKSNGIVVKNPTVDLEKFKVSLYPVDSDQRIKLIMVGSYSNRKNQRFGAEILYELLKKRPDSKMTFIGYPRNDKEDYLPKLKKYVRDSCMENKVEFLPQDTNVAEALSKSTIMLIPSLQEGLPNVALEAQAMGVPCFVSTDVSEDCNCGICSFLPLSKGPKYWADKIIEYINENGFGKHYVDMSSWDNKKVCQMYLEYWRGKPMSNESGELA